LTLSCGKLAAVGRGKRLRHSLHLVLNVVEGKKCVKKTNIALAFVLDGREIKD